MSISQKQIIEIFGKVESILLITDSKGKFLHANGLFFNAFGIVEENLTSNFPDNFLLYSENRDSIKLEEYPFISAVKNKTGISANKILFDNGNDIKKWFNIISLPFQNSKGEVEFVITTFNEITAEYDLLKKLERAEKKFTLLAETSEDLVFILDKKGHFVFINRNGADSLGYLPDEINGNHFFEFIEDGSKEETASAFESILTNDDVTLFDSTFIGKSGNQVVYQIHAIPTKENGDITGMLSVGRNITLKKKDESKLKDLNAKLIEANRIISIERERAKHQITVLEEINKLKSQFVSNVSHELRTPLASIVGFAETISSDTELPKEMVLEFSTIILNEGKRLAKLINDILDFSKLEIGEEELAKKEFDLIDLINGLIKIYGMQANEKGLTLSSQIPEAEILINADKDRIANAIGHLLANSIKFTKSGGRITVIAQDFLKEVEIMINDTGIGISEKALPNIFQKFSKVDRPGAQLPGAGFGLVTVKKIIDLHKGIIQVKSEVDKGSTFIIRLPKN